MRGDFKCMEVRSCVVLAWWCEEAISHLSTLCDDDGKLWLVVWSRRNILFRKNNSIYSVITYNRHIMQDKI